MSEHIEPLFEGPTEDQTTGRKRYFAKLRQDKKALHHAAERFQLPVNEAATKEFSFVITTVVCMNVALNTLRKIHNLTAFDIMTLGGISFGQYSWSTMVQKLFFYYNPKYANRRISDLVHKGYLYEVKEGKKRKIHLTQKGQEIADHLAMEVHNSVERLGIIKG